MSLSATDCPFSQPLNENPIRNVLSLFLRKACLDRCFDKKAISRISERQYVVPLRISNIGTTKFAGMLNSFKSALFLHENDHSILTFPSVKLDFFHRSFQKFVLLFGTTIDFN